jgi:dTDP-glucose 4,6-dehydratase
MERVKLAKVLLTGGAGFIGSNFLKMFSLGVFPEFSEIAILDKLTYAGKIENITEQLGQPNIFFHEGDICDAELVKSIAEDCDFIINMAAESHVDRSIVNSDEFVRTNILGTQVLLDVAKVNKGTRFVQISTDEVYGSIESGSWDENSPVSPNSPYSASKAAADLLVNAFHVTYGLDTIITRCSNNFGPQQYPEKIIPFFVKQLAAKQKVPVYGDGQQTRDWLYVDDHCRGIYTAATLGASGEIYNIGGGVELRNLELVGMLLTELGLDESFIEFVPDRLGHDRRYSVNWSKISKLGYAPDTNFDLQLNSTIEWYLNAYKV